MQVRFVRSFTNRCLDARVALLRDLDVMNALHVVIAGTIRNKPAKVLPQSVTEKPRFLDTCR